MMTGQILTRGKSPIQSFTINHSMKLLGQDLILDRSGHDLMCFFNAPLVVSNLLQILSVHYCSYSPGPSGACHYGRLESVTVLHLPNSVINSRDMGPIV